MHFFTLATVDLDATRRFYGALGWVPTLDAPGEIIFYQTAQASCSGIPRREKFNADLAQAADHSQVSGITLAHNVGSQDEVVELAAAMIAAGGTTLKPPQPGQFGGVFHAHVQDPNGVIWEIAHNPNWRVNADGTVSLG